jgi:hypothetical protein
MQSLSTKRRQRDERFSKTEEREGNWMNGKPAFTGGGSDFAQGAATAAVDS